VAALGRLQGGQDFHRWDSRHGLVDHHSWKCGGDSTACDDPPQFATPCRLWRHRPSGFAVSPQCLLRPLEAHCSRAVDGSWAAHRVREVGEFALRGLKPARIKVDHSIGYLHRRR
jgi:hypothetical protein